MKRICIILVLAATTVHAGTVDDPEITDPADAPATPAADIVAVWLDAVSDQSVGVHIQTTSMTEPPALTELGLRVLINGTYTVLGITDMPGMHSGGFHCPGEADSFDSPDSAACASLEFTISDNAIHLDVPLAAIRASPGESTGELVAYSEVFGGEDGGIDTTAPGRSFVIPARSAGGGPPGELPDATPTMPDATPRSTPGPAFGLIALAILAAARRL